MANESSRLSSFDAKLSVASHTDSDLLEKSSTNASSSAFERKSAFDYHFKATCCEQDEDRKVMAALRDRIRPNNKDPIKKIADGTLGLKCALEKEECFTFPSLGGLPDSPLKESAVKEFIIRNADLLPKGLQTKVSVMERALAGLREETIDANSNSRKIGEYTEIMYDMKHIAEYGEDRKDFFEELQHLVLTKINILKFHDKYTPQYRDTPLDVLRRVLTDLRLELREKAELANQVENKREKARTDFAETFRTYHELVKSGRTPKEAMIVLTNDELEKRNQKSTAQVQVKPTTHIRAQMRAYPRAPTPSTFSDSDEGYSEDNIYMVQEFDEVMGNLVLHKVPKLSIEKDDNSESTSHNSTMDQDIDMFGGCDDLFLSGSAVGYNRPGAPASPSKRRNVSHGDRNPSPPKRGKVTATKNKSYIPFQS